MPIHFNSPDHVEQRSNVEPLTLDQAQHAIAILNEVCKIADVDGGQLALGYVQALIWEYENLKHAALTHPKQRKMTRKIKSLQPNECILISTKREALIIKRKTGCLHTIKEMKGRYYYKHQDVNCIAVNPNEIVLTASDFIKPSLKDRVRALEKQIAKNIEVKDAGEVKLGLEVGSWYKRNTGCIFLFNGNLDIDNLPMGVGFLKGKEYIDSTDTGWGLSSFGNDTWKEAEHEEVEAALISEAKIRYKGDVIILTPSKEQREYELRGLYTYTFNNNELWADSVGFSTLLFKDGQWAEVVEKPKQIDWSVPGQLVSYTLNSNTVVMTSGDHNNQYFFGSWVRIEDNAKIDKIGKYSDRFVKKYFKTYTGEPIILNPMK